MKRSRFSIKKFEKQPRFTWRSGRDSNPRGIAPKLISSQPRYDHFDTAACIFRNISPQKTPRKKERTDDENYKIFSS